MATQHRHAWRSMPLVLTAVLHAKFLTFHTADIKVRAMICSGCGLISMFGDVEKLRVLKPGKATENELAPEWRQEAGESIESRKLGSL